MNKRLQIAASVVLVAGAAVLGLLAAYRIRDMKEFTRPHRVETTGGTNYVVRLTETTVGRTDNGYVVIVYLRLENPNPYEIALKRNKFLLIDHVKSTYTPSTTGTGTDLIRLQARGVIVREMLSYTVQDKAFAGALELELGPNNRVEVKNGKPFREQLQIGEFRSFRRRGW